MKTNFCATLAVLVPLALCTWAASASELIWRGTLQDQGRPANGLYDLRVELHGARTAGTALASPIEFGGVTVTDGAFELPLQLSPLIAAQPELWLEVAVRGSGETRYEPLPARAMAKGAAACWSTGGNPGGGGAFIGTTDNTALELRANNRRVGLHVAIGTSPSYIGGSASNIAFGQGTTISGGGAVGQANSSSDDYGTIAGGLDNQTGNNNGFNTTDAAYASIGGGLSNRAAAQRATVAGGVLNVVNGVSGTISGGSSNLVTGLRGTIAGGDLNEAGNAASVGGGLVNIASGGGAVVPGGVSNEASGSRSFAAGNRAKAVHDGAFVWADSAEADFASQTPDQIRLRAAGGMHLQSANLGVDAPDLGNADAVELVIEGGDAQMYLMSNNVGALGSAIGLGEMSGSNLVNTWSIARETSGGGNDLRFAFGTDPVAAANAVKVEFRDDGTVFKSSGSASWDVVSDQRLKIAIAPLENALESLLQLRGVRFEYSLPALPDGIALPRGEQVGFLAQEVRQVFPDWVGETDEGYLFVGERGTTALLVEALRELDARNAALEQRIAVLEAAARQ